MGNKSELPNQISNNFIQEIIENQINSNESDQKLVTRFPPEPNGYLHIGHAKSISINFELAKIYEGKCHLRFDDTNPTKESPHFIESIKKDIKWLGWDWGSNLFYASDYFQQLFEYATKLTLDGKAYVDESSQEQIRELRGTLNSPGLESKYRNRPISENISLLNRMKNGDFEEGAMVLRAKIDMKSGNINLRDPVLYRIIKTPHFKTGTQWKIYPTYDFAHGQSDSIEKITHSICTMEFEDHRPLYNWLIENINIHHPQQIEFARLNLSYTVLSKRKLSELVENKHVQGWDDPRMPTISGLRKRGYTAESIKNFCNKIGVAKRQNTVEIQLLEHCVREDLNKNCKRIMGVINPLKVVITNYPENKSEKLEAINNPEQPEMGSRQIEFSREIYIDSDDFMENPPKKYFRLSPGKEVRLRYGYIIKCTNVIRDKISNKIIQIECEYDPQTKGGYAPDGRKIKGTIHWVSSANSFTTQVNLFHNLFTVEKPDEHDSITEVLNPNSIEVFSEAKIENHLLQAKPDEKFQFERLGYFCVDQINPNNNLPIFNRTVTLRDSWNKIQKSNKSSS
ncbi:MAG: glutamine--tRNA ligase/YqeY domain fusion protein [SAR202 cluster bacterium]|nr:glutamine--tRNA ligase/YqeY domain fusion protein [SAR202 cluster bacterium]|tara:strand:- start:4169 stop:5872 length:1704 start_codon:yes stop_codon:yes gene_type:complete